MSLSDLLWIWAAVTIIGLVLVWYLWSLGDRRNK